MKLFYTVLFIFILTFLNGSIFSQWSSDPNVNLQISDPNGEQVLPKIAGTSDGGCYVSWFDSRNGSYAVYMQLLNSSGEAQWTAGGLLISDHPQNSYLVDYDLTTDANDNAIIVFTDIRNAGNLNVFTYKLNPQGDFLWGADGISLSGTNDFQPDPKVAVTTEGNAVVVWTNFSTPSKIAAQMLAPDGTKLWGTDPIYFESTNGHGYSLPDILPGNSGSVIMLWEDVSGNFPSQTINLFTQKILADGMFGWGTDPVVITTTAGISFYEFPELISDGNGGAIFYWYDDRDFNNLFSTFVQWITSDGTLQFPANGSEASTNGSNHHLNPVAVFNQSTNETYAFWVEQNSIQSVAGVFGQKFASDGTRLWANYGKQFKAMDGNTVLALNSLVNGNNEYVYYLEEIDNSFSHLVKAFSIDTDGNFNWSGDIIIPSTVVSSKSRLVSDINSNAMSKLVWSDGRIDNGGIYAQNINADGSLGIEIVPVELVSFTANYVNENVELRWETATEINNSGFEIERKPQNTNFEEIGFLQGNGTTAEKHQYVFKDKNVATATYQYRLKQIDFDGSFEYSNIIEVDVTIPGKFSLEQNYPNPFNPTTKIKFTITKSPLPGGDGRGGLQLVKLVVYDLLGNKIATLVNEEKPAGTYEVEFNAGNLPSGIYMYQLKAGKFIQTKKLILMK
ncbi:hypothetical protein BMS3Abin03_01306 [bacterium BMS3Abin03]|nr:hypothetical protein BMS3Abin03_01306 [bacterium BMS3Abin03]